MSVYLIGFFVSTLIIKVTNVIKKNQRFVLILVALLIPCLIAGLRDKCIGTDVQTYLSQMTDAAISAENFSDYMTTRWFMIWRNLYVSDYEIGFSTTVYIVAKLFRNIYAVQFVIQGLVIVPICYSLYKNNQTQNSLCWVGILTYYFMFFNSSLNLMRQSIAMAFIFLAFTFFENKNNKICCFFTIVAVLFHTSAVIGILIYFIYNYVNAEKKVDVSESVHDEQRKNINMMVVILVGFVIVVGTGIATKILSSIGLSKYVGYISGNIMFMPNQILSRLPAILILLYAMLYAKRKNRTFQNFQFYFTMMIFDVLLAQFTSVNSFAGRIGMYFSQFEMLAFPAICYETRNKKIIQFCLIGYMLFYWWFFYVLNGVNSTVPYVLGV